MQESLLVITEVIMGTIFTGIGCVLGAYLLKRTYVKLTHPQTLILNMEKDDVPNHRETEVD